MCHCGAVVKELLARADKRGSTPSTLFSVSLYRFFFFCLVFVFNTIFPFALFSFIFNVDSADHAH